MNKLTKLWMLAVIAIAAFPLTAFAGALTEQLRKSTDQAIAILNNHDLSVDRKRDLLRKAADDVFNWTEMSRRALGPHWSQLNPEQKKEFVHLFSQLLDRTYLEKVGEYSGEKVVYTGEKIDGDYATVDMNVITNKNTEIPVVNKMKRTDDQWMIYDVFVEGVSLINNYRSQFNSILAKSPVSELIKILREKVSEK